MEPSSRKRKSKDRLIGRVLADRYEIQSRLGKGGMAVVYQAHDRTFDRLVAVKVLRTDVASDPVASKRLMREAKAAGRLLHPHIITMHDVGAADGMVFVVMELLKGGDLSDLMDAEGQLGVPRSLEIARQIAAALVVAHNQGIIHRDIKPENLFLVDNDTGRDFVKVLDFSIAKLPKQMVTAALTQAGSVFGTPHYMAPEQVEGRTASLQTDIYALGAVLFECIAGYPPFDGDSVVDILMKQAREAPPQLREAGVPLPPGLNDLVDAMLSKKAADRPQSTVELEATLTAMLAEAKAGVVEGQRASPALTVPVDLPEVQSGVADVAAPPVVPSDLPEPLLPNFSRAVTKQDSRAPLPAPVEDPALMTMRGVGLAAQVNAELARRKSALSAPAVEFDVPPPPKERPRVPPADIRAPTAAVPPPPGKSAPKPSLAKQPVMTGQAPVAPEAQRAQAPTSPDPTAQTVDLEPSSSSGRERAARAETLLPSRMPNQDQAARRDPSTESASSNTTLIISVAAGIVLFVAGVVAVYTLLG